MLAIDGTTLLAHGIHYAVVAVGVVGLGLLLIPRPGPTRRPVAGLRSPGAGDDDHAERVARLRASLSGPPAAVLDRPRDSPTAPETPACTRALALPVALVSSAAAAGVHAAVGPVHLEEGLLVGSFFLMVAVAQLVWAGAALLAPTRPLLAAGAVGNLAVVALWVTTRTVGLPFGLLEEAEAVGLWDVAATGWELVTAAVCLTLLARGSLVTRVHPPAPWHPAARAWLVTALGMLVLMTALSGGAA